jgi:hypothetical protein
VLLAWVLSVTHPNQSKNKRKSKQINKRIKRQMKTEKKRGTKEESEIMKNAYMKARNVSKETAKKNV